MKGKTCARSWPAGDVLEQLAGSLKAFETGTCVERDYPVSALHCACACHRQGIDLLCAPRPHGRPAVNIWP
ncbi:hypothetical protein COCC4DRAFT_32581, partial [Bipolaris maydis ATCC 48331]